MSDVTVIDNPELSRFEARLADGTLAGIAEYQRTDDAIVFTHTQIEPAYEGQGIGSAIARFALDCVRDDGTRQVVAECSFIRAWMERHPEYLGVTAPGPRA